MPKKQTFRTPIPTKAPDQLTLAAAVYAKHLKDGKNSPLNAIDEWPEVGPTIQEASDAQTQIDAMEKDLEKLYETRDNLLPGIVDVTRRSRGLLASIYSKAPRTLGDWGYTVDDTPRPAPAKKAAKPA